MTGRCPKCRGSMEPERVSSGFTDRAPLSALYCAACDLVTFHAPATRSTPEPERRKDLA